MVTVTHIFSGRCISSLDTCARCQQRASKICKQESCRWRHSQLDPLSLSGFALLSACFGFALNRKYKAGREKGAAHRAPLPCHQAPATCPRRPGRPWPKAELMARCRRFRARPVAQRERVKAGNCRWPGGLEHGLSAACWINAPAGTLWRLIATLPKPMYFLCIFCLWNYASYSL